jgi:chemotaxis protein histidine kinase CheA
LPSSDTPLSPPFLLREHANSVVATRKRLKELQAEYERVHHELEETVSEAEKMSQKLRSTLAYNK